LGDVFLPSIKQATDEEVGLAHEITTSQMTMGAVLI